MHFAAVISGRVHGLRFHVPELKKIKETAGEIGPAAWVKFDNGMLDTKAMGYTEEEAAAIRKRLEKVQIHGVQLIENEGEVTAAVETQKPVIRFSETQQVKEKR